VVGVHLRPLRELRAGVERLSASAGSRLAILVTTDCCSALVGPEPL
jgi:hypothetical protein